ncbi:MAG TPA: HAD family hydrolase [Candidatus Deferrimicrobium sp.]|nr:HAD family hydrolase [Candidatus Kapabacteria bacterium]HLP61032.1 HAD family hydrolase [Candidatus Deferrimicrobium sp.]
MNKAIFLDRDGTIIEEKGYISELRQSHIFPFSAAAVRYMNEKQYKVIGITNQSAIVRGICTHEQVETIHNEIIAALAQEGAFIDRFYYCPFHPDFDIPGYREQSNWRKPLPGMILQAAADFTLDLSNSYMIGDDLFDIEAGKNAGCKTVLVLTGKGRQAQEMLRARNIQPDMISENILTAIKEICG